MKGMPHLVKSLPGNAKSIKQCIIPDRRMLTAANVACDLSGARKGFETRT